MLIVGTSLYMHRRRDRCLSVLAQDAANCKSHTRHFRLKCELHFLPLKLLIPLKFPDRVPPAPKPPTVSG